MKAIFLALTLMIQTLSAAPLSSAAFLKLDDQAKLEFLEQHAKEVYDADEIAKLLVSNSEINKHAQSQGKDLARVWPDTILEGPYSQTGDAEVEVSSVYLLKGKIIAVRAYVSAAALFTDFDDCKYDEDQNQWSEECPTGSIVEGYYIDSSGERIQSDDYPEFND